MVGGWPLKTPRQHRRGNPKVERVASDAVRVGSSRTSLSPPILVYLKRLLPKPVLSLNGTIGFHHVGFVSASPSVTYIAVDHKTKPFSFLISYILYLYS